MYHVKFIHFTRCFQNLITCSDHLFSYPNPNSNPNKWSKQVVKSTSGQVSEIPHFTFAKSYSDLRTEKSITLTSVH